MSDTVFKKVDWSLGGLIEQIRSGGIGLPDIQRPFVWKNVKVRDLFDSMYRGYPVGYLLLWETGADDGHRAIGTDRKALPPSLVIVDGQQRLTSLYAVLKGVEIVRSDFSRERIHIAFNPLEAGFEVASAATRQDPAFIPDISILWSESGGLFAVYEKYLKGLRRVREISVAEERLIQNSLTKLDALTGFPLTVLQLSANVSEEDVAEVFVRINSKGKSLNQADFILTLMSVFWDDGRRALETFSREAQQPSAGGASAYNHFIKPSPDQLLRVSVGLAFRRARLQSVYSVLRGKDLDNDQFSEEHREQQFGRLKGAQERVLNLHYWHDFMRCLWQAGYRTARMINSENALLYSYVLYLIGRTEINVPEHGLRAAVAQWFFMASLTGRYTGSPESAMESDLAMLRTVAAPDEFLSRLRRACNIALTTDFWEVTLPNELATSAARSPSLFAFEAALVILDAPVLFSETKVADWLDPVVKPPKSIERHHLFPKGHLAKQGILNRRDTNQIANYAYVEWHDNLKISDRAPSEYLPEMARQFSLEELTRMFGLHALPDGWERMAYAEFLMRRRTLMAQTIRSAYETLSEAKSASGEESGVVDLTSIIAAGEDDHIEFKSTLRVNLHTGNHDERMGRAVVKTIAGFMNTHGGTLVIGVADDGTPVGIEADGFANEDKMNLHLFSLLNSQIGAAKAATVHANFDEYERARVLIVRCEASKSPVFVKDSGQEDFYVRVGPGTRALSVGDASKFIKERFG